jgi:gliding motility-associated transport system permease protein
MRLWAEERRTGTIELVATLPLRTSWLVLGKFFAAWGFVGIALLLTFPIWITVSWLGNPDDGIIVASYLGSWLMAGSFLAVGACVSALTKNQVIAFVVCAAACFLLLVTGFPIVLQFFQGWAPKALVDGVAGVSVLTHYESLMRGVVDIRDVLYFASVICAFLVMNVLFVDWKKAH